MPRSRSCLCGRYTPGSRYTRDQCRNCWNYFQDEFYHKQEGGKGRYVPKYRTILEGEELEKAVEEGLLAPLPSRPTGQNPDERRRQRKERAASSEARSGNEVRSGHKSRNESWSQSTEDLKARRKKTHLETP